MMKYIYSIATVSALAISLFGTILFSPDAKALTNAQEKACFDTYASSNAEQKLINKLKNDDTCYKADRSGQCRLLEERGSTFIECKRSDGTYATSGEWKAPDPKPPGGETIDGCDDIETSLVDCDTSRNNPVLSMVLTLVKFLAIGVGIAVVGGIVWGSLVYVTSNGESAKTQQGISIIVNAVIGLLLFLFAYALINFLVPGGLIAE